MHVHHRDRKMTDRSAPFFSVIVPTRERADTLVSTLRTCVGQDFRDMEIIVSDNFSADRTRDVALGFGESRIRYVNAGRRMSMTENWEYALTFATGRFITYVGDDDGLLPNALSDLAQIIERTQCDAITWKWASYFWPDSVDERLRNLCFIPTEFGYEERDPRLLLQQVLRFGLGYEALPFLYKGVVSRYLIEIVKRESGGRFFHAQSPDVYSAIVLAAVSRKFIFSKRPYSANGTSRHSNGASQFRCSPRDEPGTPAGVFDSEQNIPFHCNLVFAPSLPIIVGDAFLHAHDHFPPVRAFALDLLCMVRAALADAAVAPRARFDAVATAVREIAAKNAMNLDPKLFSHKGDAAVDPVALVPGFNLVRKHVIVDCRTLGIVDIYQASMLCAFVLNRRSAGFAITWRRTVRTTIAIAIGLVRRWISTRLRKSS